MATAHTYDPYTLSCEYSEDALKEFTLAECVDTTVNPRLKRYAKPLYYAFRPQQFENYTICTARSGKRLLAVMCHGIKDVLINNQKVTISIGMDGRVIKRFRNNGIMKQLSQYSMVNMQFNFGVAGIYGTTSPRTLASAHMLEVSPETNRNIQRIDLMDKPHLRKIAQRCDKVVKLGREESVLLFEDNFRGTTDLYPLDLENNIIGNSLFKGYYKLSSDDGSCTVGAAIWQSSLIYKLLDVGDEVPWPVKPMENEDGYNMLFGMFANGNEETCKMLFRQLVAHLAHITITEPARHNMEGARMSTIVREEDLAAPGVCPNYLLCTSQRHWRLSSVFEEWPIHWDDFLVNFHPFEPNTCQMRESVPFFIDPRDMGNTLYSPEIASL